MCDDRAKCAFIRGEIRQSDANKLGNREENDEREIIKLLYGYIFDASFLRGPFYVKVKNVKTCNRLRFLLTFHTNTLLNIVLNL